MTNRVSMYEDRSTDVHLGVVVGESLVGAYYTDLVAMDYGCSGFDFISSDGFKIDSKIASLALGDDGCRRDKAWVFNIRKNTEADFFCCIGVDNKQDLNVICAWLIPSNAKTTKGTEVCELTGLAISKSNIDFWKDYELDTDILNELCSELKIVEFVI